MTFNEDSTSTLGVIVTVRDGLIQARMVEQTHRKALMDAVISAHEDSGVSVDALSSASGLTVREIRSELSGASV